MRAESAQVLDALEQAGIFRRIGSAWFSGARQLAHIRNQLFAEGRPLRVERLLARDLFRRGHGENGAIEIVPFRLAGHLVDIVEVSEDLIKLLLRDAVELLSVAAGAAQLQPDK